MVSTVDDVRHVVVEWLDRRGAGLGLGLPEWDDRARLWRVALVSKLNGREPLGEIQVSSDGCIASSTDLTLVAARKARAEHTASRDLGGSRIAITPVPSKLVLGDAREVLREFPRDTAQLVFTSPPYFNAKPQCHESLGYDEYLNLLRDVFEQCHAILSEGRFLVVNTSPVLVRRTSRSSSSRRIPITFDLHAILSAIGFEFIDDIVWQKPDGAGWNLGRGRRFAADRQPLQYKAVTVTENVTVYRKQTLKLIDWNLRNHPNPQAVTASRIGDGYERTNIWKIPPTSHRSHPCVFPDALAERVVRYYSFAGDLVLDPFAGTGTVGRVAGHLKRRFLMVERSLQYFDIQRADPAIAYHAPDIDGHQYFAGTI